MKCLADRSSWAPLSAIDLCRTSAGQMRAAQGIEVEVKERGSFFSSCSYLFLIFVDDIFVVIFLQKVASFL